MARVLTRSSNFNSGKFSDIAKGVDHSKKNTLKLSSISEVIEFEGAIIPEPHGILEREKVAIFSKLMDFEVNSRTEYRPEVISEILYGTPDLWYLVLKANKMLKATDIKRDTTIKVVRPSTISTLVSVIQKNADTVRKNKKNPPSMLNRTLVSID